MKKLFVAWQDPVSRRWFPVGRLSANNGHFEFAYTNGALQASKAGFRPLASFPEMDRLYESDQLFPLFANRLPSHSRPDYAEYVQYLNLPVEEDDPIVLLARSGGRRETDALEVFPCPEPNELGEYHLHFFVHGVRHHPKESHDRILKLQAGDPLLLLLDFQNPHDPNALALRTNDSFPGDRYLLGYCPGYLVFDVIQVLHNCPVFPNVTVERINPPPAPLQLRLLCNLTTCWPDGFEPCTESIFQPAGQQLAPA